MLPITLKTKYAFHALLWLLDPDVVLDVGSMDGADSKRFRKLLGKAEIVAFEANPANYSLINSDKEIQNQKIRVVNRLVAGKEGDQSFFIQRPSQETNTFNRGTSSALPRTEPGMVNEEVRVSSVRLDSFLNNEYPQAENVAMWVDVEGFAYEVLESIRDFADRIQLIHVEVETRECWLGQKLEADVLQLLEGMGYILLAHGKNDVQRDLVLVSKFWYYGNTRRKIDNMLWLAQQVGPALSKTLTLFPPRRGCQ